MTNEKIILQLEKGYDIKNPQLAQVLTNIENNGVTKEEFAEAMETKADLIGGKVPAEQLPSYVDDIIEFESIINGSTPINFYLNNQSYTDKVYYIQGSTSIEGTLSFKYPNKFIDFGANTSEEDWTIIEPEEGKIYIKIGSGNDSNHSFRWSGSDLIDLDKNWSDRINTLELKTLTSNLGTITNPLDLSESTSTSSLTQLYSYLSQRNKSSLINLLWYHNGAAYSSPIIDVDPIERTFAIYNQRYLQTYKILKEDNNYSLVKVKEFSDFVYLDYSTVGSVLDDNTIERIRNASIVLVNNDPSIPNINYVYTAKLKTKTYLQFIRVSDLGESENVIVYHELSINTNTKRWTIATKRYTFPYGAYTSFGFTGKSSSAVNQEVARLVNMNSYNITSSDLNKVHSGDKLENIKNATFLILDEGSGKTKIFVRGYTSTTIIYYNCISNSGSVNSILLRMSSNTLSPIETTQFDDVFYSYYSAKGGTKVNKDELYKEFIAQLTENTYVLDSSKLNTVLTNEEDTAILNATTIIVSNYPNNKPMVFIRGYDQTSQISFLNTSESIDGSVVFNKLKYIKNSKIASIVASVINPYQWYATHGGTIKDQSNFESINAFLYDRTYIIDKALLNSTITDTSIQDNIKTANILVVKDSTNSSYKVHIRGFVTSNAIYFFNMQNANSDNITATRVLFNTTTNLLSSNDIYLQSAFNAYKLGGGTKYTTESAFNKAFAAAIDAYTSTI
jgi:hypothetical protein